MYLPLWNCYRSPIMINALKMFAIFYGLMFTLGSNCAQAKPEPDPEAVEYWSDYYRLPMDFLIGAQTWSATSLNDYTAGIRTIRAEAIAKVDALVEPSETEKEEERQGIIQIITKLASDNQPYLKEALEIDWYGDHKEEAQAFEKEQYDEAILKIPPMADANYIPQKMSETLEIDYNAEIDRREAKADPEKEFPRDELLSAAVIGQAKAFFDLRAQLKWERPQCLNLWSLGESASDEALSEKYEELDALYEEEDRVDLGEALNWCMDFIFELDR